MTHTDSLSTRSASTTVPSTRTALVRVGALVALLVVASVVAYRMGWFDYQHTLQHIQHVRQAHSLVLFTTGFVVVFGLGASIGFPALPFTVAAGVLFGTVLGGVLSWLGAMIGASCGYWIARTVGHREVLRWVQRYKRASGAIEQARDFTGMLRLRLIPVLPLGIVNFVGGLARAPFGAYLAATGIGIAPSLFIYSYFADSLVEGVGSGRKNATTSLIIASVLLILLSLIPKLVARKNTPR